MARFRGTIQGNRGEASRLGSPNSGLVATADGWEAGVRVEAAADGDADTFAIYATAGSNGRTRDRFIGEIVRTVDGRTYFEPDQDVRKFGRFRTG